MGRDAMPASLMTSARTKMKARFVFVAVCLIVATLFSGCSSQAVEIPVTGSQASETQKAASQYVAGKALEFISAKSAVQFPIASVETWAFDIQTGDVEGDPLKFIYTTGDWKMIVQKSFIDENQYVVTITNENDEFLFTGLSDGEGNITDLTPRKSPFNTKW